MGLLGRLKDKISKANKTGSALKSERVNRGATKQSFVHDTAGGEMPDPGKVPSKTDYHTDVKRNI